MRLIHSRMGIQSHPRRYAAQPAPEQGGIGRVSAGKGITEGRPLCLGHRMAGSRSQAVDPAYVFQGSSQQSPAASASQPDIRCVLQTTRTGWLRRQNPKSSPLKMRRKNSSIAGVLLCSHFKKADPADSWHSISCRDDSLFRSFYARLIHRARSSTRARRSTPETPLRTASRSRPLLAGLGADLLLVEALQLAALHQHLPFTMVESTRAAQMPNR